MKLQEAYEFSEWTQREGLLVAAARERATGKAVQIHLFPSTKTDEAVQMFQQVWALPDDARRKILKCGQGEGGGYFVTEPLPKDLKSWFDDAQPARSAAVPEVSAATQGQLREMPINPVALAPLVPGPEPVRKIEPIAPVQQPVPAAPAPQTGENTMFLNQMLARSGAGPADAPRNPVPPPVSRQEPVAQPVAQAIPASQPGAATVFMNQMLARNSAGSDDGRQYAAPAPVAPPAMQPAQPASSPAQDAAPGADTLLRRLYGNAAPAWREQEIVREEPPSPVPAPPPMGKDAPGLATFLGLSAPKQSPPPAAPARPDESKPLNAPSPAAPFAVPRTAQLPEVPAWQPPPVQPPAYPLPAYQAPPVPPPPAPAMDSLWSGNAGSQAATPPQQAIPPVVQLQSSFPPPPVPAPMPRAAKNSGAFDVKTMLIIAVIVLIAIAVVVKMIG